MAAVRQWHPVRLALVCAILAMAGGASSARAVYAEVSARAVAVARAEADAKAAPLAVERAAPPSLPPVARVVAPAHVPSFVSPRLYLAHCALLL